MDMTFPIGVDLERDPIVTEVDGGELRECPGCRIFVPEPLGEVEATSAMPNGCQSHHGAAQDPVERILSDLWPKLAECRTAKELGAVILVAGVDVKMKRPLALAARDRLGATWSPTTVQHWLQLGSHSDGRAEKRREVRRKANQVWYADPVNAERAREMMRQASRAWYAENPGYQNEYRRTRREIDPAFALAHRLRSRLRNAVKAVGAGKAAKTFELVGCTPEELKQHLESQFVDGMTWENRELWHVEHIRPLASFQLEDPAQQAASMHWSNLAPRWASDNLTKSSHHDGRHWRHSDHK